MAVVSGCKRQQKNSVKFRCREVGKFWCSPDLFLGFQKVWLSFSSSLVSGRVFPGDGSHYILLSGALQEKAGVDFFLLMSQPGPEAGSSAWKALLCRHTRIDVLAPKGAAGRRARAETKKFRLYGSAQDRTGDFLRVKQTP